MPTAKERAEARVAAIKAREEKLRRMRQKTLQQARAMVAKEEKRRVWKVGEAAMAAMAWSEAVRDAVAKELARDGVLRQQNDPDVFADLLAGTYVPTRAEIEERASATRDRRAGTGRTPPSRRSMPRPRRGVTRPANPEPSFPFRRVDAPRRRADGRDDGRRQAARRGRTEILPHEGTRGPRRSWAEPAARRTVTRRQRTCAARSRAPA